MTASCCSSPIPASRKARAIFAASTSVSEQTTASHVGHGHALRAAQGHEELGRQPDALADLARRVARLAAHRALGADEQQPAVAAGGLQVGERHALGGELLQQLRRASRASLEPLEQAFGGEVGAHGPQA